MKNQLLVPFILIHILIEGIFQDTFLDKFHQNAFKIRDVRIQLMSYDRDYYNFFEIKPFKYNRTTTAHNITANFKVSVKDKIEILIQTYKFLSNEYRHFPARFQVNAKKAVDANLIGLGQTIKTCGNISSFYFYKDVTYHLCNFVVDEKHLPPLIPYGRYKMEGTTLYFNREIAQTAMFCEVYEPIVYPKK